MIIPPIHLTLFNKSSVELLLKRIGFDRIEVTTPGRLDWDIVEQSIDSQSFDPGRFWRMVADEATDECKAELQQWIASNGLSSHMWVLARRPL